MTLDIDDSEMPLIKKMSSAVTLTVHLPNRLSLSLSEQPVRQVVQFVSALVKEFEPCLV